MTNFYEGKKVFVAGGAGMIGQSLVRRLTQCGARVTTTEYLSRKIDQLWASRCERVIQRVDLMDCQSPIHESGSNIYDGQEIVFWAAAKVGGAKMIRENPMDLVHYNLELATRNIKAAVQAGVDRFCYVSSSYVYPELEYSEYYAEEGDAELDDVPLQHYGLGWIKRFVEKLCRAHQLTSSTKFALVRPAAIYGPHDNFDLETCHVVPALIRKVAEGRFPLEIWGDGSEERQFTYVDDLVEGLLLATEQYAVAEPINIAIEKKAKVIDVARELLSIVRRSPVDFKFVGDKPKAINRRLVDVSACKRLLNYKCATPLADGLAMTLEWYRGGAGK